MKTQNKKKIIVSTLALAMGAALAGSISGSVAWYQYSTRASAQLVGTSIGTMGQLQVKTAGVEYSDNIAPTLKSFKPISASGTAGSALTYYDHPVYQTAQLPAMGSVKGYVDYQLYFKFEESTDGTAWEQQVKNVYLTYFAIENAGTNDISSAVRVELIGTDHQFLLSKSSTAEQTVTAGALDLNGNGKADTTYWDCKDDPAVVTAGDATQMNYINGTSGSYTTQAHSAAVVTVSDPYDLETGNTTKVLVATKASGDSEALTVRIWLEGWALLNSSANWTKDYLAQNFNVNMQFACSANR